MLVGEDAAAFSVEQQKTNSWVLFTVLLTGVLALIYVVRQGASGWEECADRDRSSPCNPHAWKADS